MSQQTKTKELLVLFLKKCFCQTKWAEISAQLLCTAILYTHKKTRNIDSLKVRGRESKSPMTLPVYRYIVSSTTHGIPFSPEDQPMMKFTTGLMCGFIVSSLLLAMSIPAIPPTLEKKGAYCFCMEQSIGNTEVCEAKKTISYVLSRVRLVVSYDCGWLGLMARCDQETSEDASSGLRRRSSAALRTCGIGGEEVWTSCQRTAAKSLEINILWGFMRLCQTWMGDLTSDWFTLRITCHLGNLVWDQWVQEFVYQYQYLLQFVLCFQTTVVSSGGLCFLVFLVLQNHPCPFSRNHINVWRNLCGWVSVSQSMKLPCPVGWTYCIAEKKNPLRCDSEIHAPKRQVAWPTILTFGTPHIKAKDTRTIKPRNIHGENMMKPVGCEILMLENPHRCNRRPFLSSNLRNRGWSSNKSHFVVPTEVAQLLPDVPASNGGAEGHSLCQSLKNRCKRIWYIFMPQHHKLIQDEGVLHDMLTQLQEVWDAIEQTSESLRMHEFSCYKSDFLLKPQTEKYENHHNWIEARKSRWYLTWALARTIWAAASTGTTGFP